PGPAGPRPRPPLRTGSAARVVRHLRAAGRARSARRRSPGPEAERPDLGTLGRPLAVRRRHPAHPRADRSRGRVPGEPHAPASRPPRGGPRRALPPPVPGPERPLLGLPRPRTSPRALGLAGALPPDRGRPDRRAADEGHGAQGTVGGRGPAGGPRPPRLE